jgi:hypothetical protein
VRQLSAAQVEGAEDRAEGWSSPTWTCPSPSRRRRSTALSEDWLMHVEVERQIYSDSREPADGGGSRHPGGRAGPSRRPSSPRSTSRTTSLSVLIYRGSSLAFAACSWSSPRWGRAIGLLWSSYLCGGSLDTIRSSSSGRNRRLKRRVRAFRSLGPLVFFDAALAPGARSAGRYHRRHTVQEVAERVPFVDSSGRRMPLFVRGLERVSGRW